MKRLLKWFWLFHKRLYKKPVFLVILATIPLLVLFLGIAAKQESGFVRVALCEQDGDHSMAAAICDELKSGSSLIVFTRCTSPREAEAMVRTGQADAAWIFCRDFQEKLQEFSQRNSRHVPVITVIEREQTIPLRLSHEKLTSVLYGYCARALFLDFIRTELDQLSSVSDRELLEDYDSFAAGEDLFVFETTSSLPNAEGTSTGYLTAPVRGLLSIVVMLCGLAAALFCMQDEENGTFSWVPYSKKMAAAFASQSIAVLNVSVIMLLALYVSGLGTSLVREVVALLLFAVSCTVFCMLLQQITGSIKVLCSLIPLLAVVMIAVCPIFFDLKSLALPQLLFPPTYYLRAVYNNTYLLYMVLYILCLTGLNIIGRKVLKRGI